MVTKPTTSGRNDGLRFRRAVNYNPGGVGGNQSRRGVLEALASVVALPAVSDVDLEDEQKQQRLPDVDDGDPFWILVYWAAQKGDMEAVEDEWLPIMALFSSQGMDEGELWGHVHKAAEGEYDVDGLGRQAALAWDTHSR